MSAATGAEPRTLLVVLPSWLGDTTMAEPALRAVRAALPRTRIVHLGRPGLASILEGRGLADATIDEPMRGPLGPWRAALAARRRAAPDSVLLLPNSARSAIVGRLCGARRRIGYARDGRRLLLTDPISPPREVPIPAIDWYARLVERWLVIEIADRRPRLVPTEAQRAEATRLLDGVRRPFALLNPGANRADKRWPAAHFAALARFLAARGLSIVVNGGPAEGALVASIAATTGGVDLVARGVTIPALVGVLAEARLMATNDTGPRHVALALDVPTIAFFGPTDHRWTTTRGATERILLAEPFLPAEQIADRVPQGCRIDRIAVEDAIAAAESLLGPAGEPGARA